MQLILDSLHLITWLHQETCFNAQDACSISVKVFNYSSDPVVFRLVIGGTVSDLQRKVMLNATRSGVIEDLPSSWRLLLGGPDDRVRGFKYGPTLECEEGDHFRISHYDTTRHRGPGLGKGDIGEFVATNELVFNRNMPSLPAGKCPGTELLLNPYPPSYVSPHIVSALAESCGGKNGAQTPAVDCNSAIVSLAACKTLRDRVERAFIEAKSSGAFSPKALPAQNCGIDSNCPQSLVPVSSCETDFKILLSPADLINIIGVASYHFIISSLGCATPDAIVLRRTAATNRFIAFHTDYAARTLRPSLTDFL